VTPCTVAQKFRRSTLHVANREDRDAYGILLRKTCRKFYFKDGETIEKITLRWISVRKIVRLGDWQHLAPYTVESLVPVVLEPSRSATTELIGSGKLFKY
jgi:hypothetical protein